MEGQRRRMSDREGPHTLGGICLFLFLSKWLFFLSFFIRLLQRFLLCQRGTMESLSHVVLGVWVGVMVLAKPEYLILGIHLYGR